RSTPADAREVLLQYSIDAPDSVGELLAAPERAVLDQASLANNPCLTIARAADALEAARAAAVEAGVEVRLLGDDIEGEARETGRIHGRMALELQAEGATPMLLLSGGETSVTVRGDGRGGRNVEYLLGLALELDGARGIHALAADTDGIDGSEDNAGAVIGPDTLASARNASLDAQAMLDDNDAYTFFAALDALVMTGPTRTNVNDFRAILVH